VTLSRGGGLAKKPLNITWGRAGGGGVARMSQDNFYWLRLIKAFVVTQGGGGEGVGKMTPNVTQGEGGLKSVTYYLNGPLSFLT
jgi:hypothetical protein